MQWTGREDDPRLRQAVEDLRAAMTWTVESLMRQLYFRDVESCFAPLVAGGSA